MANFKCEKGEYIPEEEFEKRNRFWSKEQFRTWDKKELEKDSIKMQNLLVALSKFSLPEILEIRKLFPPRKDKYEKAIYSAHKRDFNYAMTIVPKTFFKKSMKDKLIEQLESSGNFRCEKSDFLSPGEFEKRKRFWSKKQFRTWDKKELEKDSIKMQNLLVALSKFSLPEILEIRKQIFSYGFKKEADKMTVYSANTKDFDYAMSIAPKTFFKTECPNR